MANYKVVVVSGQIGIDGRTTKIYKVMNGNDEITRFSGTTDKEIASAQQNANGLLSSLKANAAGSTSNTSGYSDSGFNAAIQQGTTQGQAAQDYNGGRGMQSAIQAATVDNRTEAQKLADLTKTLNSATAAAKSGNLQPIKDFDKMFGTTHAKAFTASGGGNPPKPATTTPVATVDNRTQAQKDADLAQLTATLKAAQAAAAAGNPQPLKNYDAMFGVTRPAAEYTPDFYKPKPAATSASSTSSSVPPIAPGVINAQANKPATGTAGAGASTSTYVPTGTAANTTTVQNSRAVIANAYVNNGPYETVLIDGKWVSRKGTGSGAKIVGSVISGRDGSEASRIAAEQMTGTMNANYQRQMTAGIASANSQRILGELERGGVGSEEKTEALRSVLAANTGVGADRYDLATRAQRQLLQAIDSGNVHYNLNPHSRDPKPGEVVWALNIKAEAAAGNLSAVAAKYQEAEGIVAAGQYQAEVEQVDKAANALLVEQGKKIEAGTWDPAKDGFYYWANGSIIGAGGDSQSSNKLMFDPTGQAANVFLPSAGRSESNPLYATLNPVYNGIAENGWADRSKEKVYLKENGYTYYDEELGKTIEGPKGVYDTAEAAKQRNAMGQVHVMASSYPNPTAATESSLQRRADDILAASGLNREDQNDLIKQYTAINVAASNSAAGLIDPQQLAMVGGAAQADVSERLRGAVSGGAGGTEANSSESSLWADPSGTVKPQSDISSRSVKEHGLEPVLTSPGGGDGKHYMTNGGSVSGVDPSVRKAAIEDRLARIAAQRKNWGGATKIEDSAGGMVPPPIIGGASKNGLPN